MSLSASVFIVAVVVLRALTLYRLPKRTFLILWGIAAARLLIPFSIPFRLSFYTGMDMLLRQAPAQAASAAAPAVITPAAPNVPAVQYIADMGTLAGGGTMTPAVSPLLFIWLAGMCLCAAFFAVSYARCRRDFSTALPAENDTLRLWQQAHPMRRTVLVRQSDRIKAPLTYGIFRPVVLLPKETDWTDASNLRYILAHEYVHIRRFDALIKLILTAALCLHWFNPLVWLMVLLYNRDIELSCDEAVIRAFGVPSRSAYALALIGLEEKKRRLTPLLSSFSKNAIEARIRAIMKTKKYTVPAVITAVLLIVALTVVFATSKSAVGHSSGTQANTISAENSALRQLLEDGDPANSKGDTTAEPANNAAKEPGQDTAAGASSPVTESAEPVTPSSPAAQIVSEEGWVWPVAECVIVTAPFGMRYHPIYKEYQFTDHIDIAADTGAVVGAALDGTVSDAGFDTEQGNYIILDHDNGIQTVYRHLSEVYVSARDDVKAGGAIGAVGATGAVTGPCLAFCVRVDGNFVNPLTYYKEMFPALAGAPTP